LNRFISRSAERSLPFFKALKGKGTIEWGPEQSKAFAELKEYIEKMAILLPPSPSEPLFLYVAASKAVVSAVLVREVEAERGKLQSPVYIFSEALSGSKLLYSELEKITYAVVMATRKLRHYFEAHRVTVLTDQPLKNLFINKEASSRIAKWVTELFEHTIDFGKRSAIKSQVLADFVVDWTSPSSVIADEELVPVWEIRCDGAWGHKGAGIAAIITSPAGIKLRYVARLDYKNPSDRCTNNTTEYEALLLGLQKVHALGANNFLVKCDAKVIKDHVEKESEAREPELVKYLAEVRKMERHFRGFTIEHLPRKNNGEADEHAKKVARGEAMPPDVFFEILIAPSTRPDKKPLNTVNAIASLDWRAPIIAFLRGHYEPVETHDLKRMQARARGYILKDNNLFNLGVCAPLLKCITQDQDMELMKEIHGGMCRSHIAARALAGKAFRQGFYWPMAIKDVEHIVKTCKACQFTTKHQRRSGAPSQLITPTWPLQRWGMDIVGPLPTAQGNFKFVVVAVEFFTKWIEVRPLTTITSATIRKFFWWQIICRFGVPRELAIDNGKQFDCQDFREYCRSIGTKLCFASVYHPQSNGAVERANGQIFSAIKKCLFEQKKGKWVDELLRAIWSHNTTESRTTKFTLFRLLYGAEAMCPEELTNESARVLVGSSRKNEEVDKDLVEINRLDAVQNLLKYQEETRKWRDKKVSLKNIQVGDFVLKRKKNADAVGKF
jgi:ribonuclease HI/transposase InsO family protein